MGTYTVKDTKTGKVLRTVTTTSGGGFKTVSSSPSKSSSSSSGTKVSVVSDASSDVGKSFAGTTIETPAQYEAKKKSSSNSAPTSTNVGGTTVSFVSDTTQDIGKTIAGQKIISPAQFATEQYLRNTKSGGISKILTDKQKTQFYQSTAVSATPFMSLPESVKAEFRRIEQDRNLNTFEKEAAKRNLVGIITDPTRNTKGSSINFAPKVISSRDALNAAILKDTGRQLKEIQLNPYSPQNKYARVSITPEQSKFIAKMDEEAGRQNNAFVLKQIFDLPKFFIIGAAEYTVVPLLKLTQYSTEKSIRGVANTIGYFTTRANVLIRQAKGIDGKNYLRPGENIEGMLKGDLRRIFLKAKESGPKIWNGYQKGLSETQKGLKFFGSHPKETAVIIGSVAAVYGRKYLEELKRAPGETIGRTLAAIVPIETAANAAGTALKAKYSPFVLRGVKILEGAASQRGTGQALASLQGKRINLYSATTAQVSDLFKGTPINEKELKFLVADMKKNPDLYINKNLEIKPLSKIATDYPKRDVLNYLASNTDVVLAGSASLKLQLKNFREVGDFDVIAKDPFKVAREIAAKLNGTFSGKLTNARYKIAKSPNSVQVWDSLGRKSFNKEYTVVDVAFLSKTEEKFGKLKTVNINGIKVLDVRYDLLKKVKLSQTGELANRRQKELRDVGLILGKEMPKSKADAVKKIFEKTGFIKVENRGGSGLARRFDWSLKYVPEFSPLPFRSNPALESKIKKALKTKFGFTDKMIADNVKLYTPSDFYFAPNQIYSYYLRGDGGSIIMVKDQKISNYSKSIQDKLKKAFKGELSVKEQAVLKNDMRLYRLNNPDKVFVGQKALAEGFGEFEVLAPEFTKIYQKKTLLSREVYIPSLSKFVRVQEGVIGKQPKSVLDKMYAFFKTKLKKGYEVSEMKKDLIAWAKKNIKSFKESAKGVYVNKLTSKGRKAEQLKRARLERAEKLNLEKEKRFLKQERESLQKLDREVASSKLSAAQKTAIRTEIRDRVRRITPKKGSRVPIRVPNRASRDFVSNVRGRLRGPGRTGPNRLTIRPTLRPTPPRPPVRPVPPRQTIRPGQRPTSPPRTTTRPPASPKPPGGKIIRQPPKKPIRKVTDNKKTSTAGRLGLIQYKVGKKIVSVKSGLTYNRALSAAGKTTDNTVKASMFVKAYGSTKMKDIPRPSLNKFTIRVGKDKLVRKLVEKTKFRIDTRGEKRGLSVAKSLKANIARFKVPVKKSNVRPTSFVKRVKKVSKPVKITKTVKRKGKR